MPSSPSESIPYIIEFIRKNNPELKSVLDVGVGFGKFGFLLREYYDVKKYNAYKSDQWNLNITGVEIFPDYITSLQNEIYDQIIIGNILEVLPKLEKFDVPILSDVLEHFEKKDGYSLIEELFNHVESIVIGTPNGYVEHPAKYNNLYEKHLSGWTLNDFTRYKIIDKAIIKRFQNNNENMVVYIKK